MCWIVSIIATSNDNDASCNCNDFKSCNCLSSDQLKWIKENSGQKDNCTEEDDCDYDFIVPLPGGLRGCDLKMKIVLEGGSDFMIPEGVGLSDE